MGKETVSTEIPRELVQATIEGKLEAHFNTTFLADGGVSHNVSFYKHTISEEQFDQEARDRVALCRCGEVVDVDSLGLAERQELGYDQDVDPEQPPLWEGELK